jgi:propanol-preferring alcohol dehydrogenase
LAGTSGNPWLGNTFGLCEYCRSAREDLCDARTFAGYNRDRGFATHPNAETTWLFGFAACGG